VARGAIAVVRRFLIPDSQFLIAGFYFTENGSVRVTGLSAEFVLSAVMVSV
jgi:hypothetical protein